VIEIRPGLVSDAPAIARVRRESWHAAYTGIIPAPIIDRVTAAGGQAADPPPYRRTLVAQTGEHPAVVGYASFGPERTVAPLPGTPSAPGGRPAGGAGAGGEPAADSPADPCAPDDPDPLTADGRAGRVGEVYAIYVVSAWWSAGAGRALMNAALAALRADGYRRAVLWVLADNVRARRFYDRAGFAPDGACTIISGLGGVLEVRYYRDLSGRLGGDDLQ
jgi:ribosomal protein S18 acetylase RimI-like enzyme